MSNELRYEKLCLWCGAASATTNLLVTLTILGSRLGGGNLTARQRARAITVGRTHRNRVVLTVRLAHQNTALDTRDIRSVILVVLVLRLHQIKLNILALDQVLVLRRLGANRGIMNKDILVLLVTLTYRDETKAGLVVEPLNATRKTRGNNGCIRHSMNRVPIYNICMQYLLYYFIKYIFSV